MRLALVVQRYGSEIVGGAEAHARLLASRVQECLGWSVTVFTTTARDYQTWENYYRAGTEFDGKISIMRFSVTSGRSPAFKILRRFIPGILSLLPKAWRTHFESFYFRLQGPYCPELVEAIEQNANEYDAFLFFTYLYYPTIKGLPVVKAKSALVPTLHDESAAYFETTQQILTDARVIFVNSKAEQELIARVAPGVSSKTLVTGVGIEVPRATEGTLEPYILYLGRLGKGKGVNDLTRYFQTANSNLKLYLAGSPDPDFLLPSSSMIRNFGPVGEQERANLLRNAFCIVNPSSLESLSMLALESFLCRKPVLLNEHCAVFRDYAERFPSVFTFKDAENFDQSLRAIQAIDWTSTKASRDLDIAEHWVLENYSWNAVLKKIEKTLLQLR